ncbi:MAG: PAS domain-containing sensor histidine kinase, partial [Nostoc sp.]
MDKLQKVKLVLPESEQWFRGIFNQTFGFIGLMEPIGIFMEGNQAALKFAGIDSSKVIRCPLWEA